MPILNIAGHAFMGLKNKGTSLKKGISYFVSYKKDLEAVNSITGSWKNVQ